MQFRFLHDIFLRPLCKFKTNLSMGKAIGTSFLTREDMSYFVLCIRLDIDNVHRNL
jgi:hypothetical protein